MNRFLHISLVYFIALSSSSRSVSEEKELNYDVEYMLECNIIFEQLAFYAKINPNKYAGASQEISRMHKRSEAIYKKEAVKKSISWPKLSERLGVIRADYIGKLRSDPDNHFKNVLQPKIDRCVALVK